MDFAKSVIIITSHTNSAICEGIGGLAIKV